MSHTVGTYPNSASPWGQHTARAIACASCLGFPTPAGTRGDAGSPRGGPGITAGAWSGLSFSSRTAALSPRSRDGDACRGCRRGFGPEIRAVTPGARCEPRALAGDGSAQLQRAAGFSGLRLLLCSPGRRENVKECEKCENDRAGPKICKLLVNV